MADTAQIWETYRVGLRRFIQRRVSDPSTVDDILQDVFLKIHSRIQTLKDTARLRGWLYRIARNTIIDHYRNRIGASPLPTDLPGPPSEDRRALQELAECVRPMIERLSEPYREAVALSELEGLTQGQIAKRQGLSLPGVKSRVQRGRKKLKEMILDCCHIELDRLGTVVEIDPKNPDCPSC